MLLLLVCFWNNIAGDSHVVEKWDSYSLLQNQAEWIQILALPLPSCMTLISSPNMCFSFLKFQMEHILYM